VTEQEIKDEVRTQIRHRGMGVYAWVAVLISSITLPVLSLVISLNLNDRAIDRERMARLASEHAMCAIVVAQSDAYRQHPPTTPAGRTVADKMAALRLAYHCDER
jgi:hypothetical protein